MAIISKNCPSISKNLASATGEAALTGTAIGNEVYVLDNDAFKVYIFNLLTRGSTAYELSYKATDGQYSKYRKGTGNVLPHNFQIVQIGK